MAKKMILKNKTIQKFISSLVVVAMFAPALFVFSAPQKAKADLFGADIPLLTTIAVNTGISAGANTTLTTKTIAIEILKRFLMAIATKLLNKVTQSTINWINSGFHGNPLYLENSDSFFKDIAKYEVRNLVNLFGYDSTRFPYGKDFALNIIGSYQRQLTDNTAYSLSKVINDPVLLNNYQNNFNVGGWNGFLINTQYPQNNYLGFQMLATEELARRLQGTTQNAAQKTQTALQQGLGFLSPQTCPSNPLYNNGKNEFLQPTFNYSEYYQNHPYDFEAAKTNPNYDILYSANINAAETAWAVTNTCPGGLVATTPGSVVGDQIKTALQSKTHQAELASALGNSLAAFFNALITKLFSSGLNALTNTSGTTEEVPDFNATDYMNTLNALGDQYVPPPTTGTSTSPGTPEETPPGLSSVCSDVATERAKFPGSNLSPENLKTILSNVAGKNNGDGWGMLSKTSGNNCVGVACDIMFNGPTCYIYDVLGDSEGAATPSCNFAGGNIDRGQWVGVGADTRGSGPCAEVTPPSGGGTTPTTPPPTSGEITSLLPDLQAERAKYGTPMTQTEIGKVLNAVAWKNKDVGWVLLGKAAGSNCPAPSGAKISCDYLVHQPTMYGYDVFVDAEGAGTPSWQGPDTGIAAMVADGSRTLVAPIQP